MSIESVHGPEEKLGLGAVLVAQLVAKARGLLPGSALGGLYPMHVPQQREGKENLSDLVAAILSSAPPLCGRGSAGGEAPVASWFYLYTRLENRNLNGQATTECLLCPVAGSGIGVQPVLKLLATRLHLDSQPTTAPWRHLPKKPYPERT
jgi:hypothetical protein